jgi:hypothetical protein
VRPATCVYKPANPGHLGLDQLAILQQQQQQQQKRRNSEASRPEASHISHKPTNPNHLGLYQLAVMQQQQQQSHSLVYPSIMIIFSSKRGQLQSNSLFAPPAAGSQPASQEADQQQQCNRRNSEAAHGHTQASLHRRKV